MKPGVNRLAQRHLDVLFAADIADRSHTVREHPLADIHRLEHQIIARLFKQGEGAFFAVVANVNVGVD